MPYFFQEKRDVLILMTVGSPVIWTGAANKSQGLLFLNSYNGKEYQLEKLKSLVQDLLVAVRFTTTVHWCPGYSTNDHLLAYKI